MDSIGFYINEYLGIPETFIYEEITNIKKYKSVVLTHGIRNLEVFPHEKIIQLEEDLRDYLASSRLSRNPLKTLETIRKIRKHNNQLQYYLKIIKHNDIKLIHAQYGYDGLLCTSLCEDMGLPLVTNFRGYDVYQESLEHPQNYDKLFEVGDLFLSRSKVMKDDLSYLGCPKGKIRIHHSSIDVKKFPFRERSPLKKDETLKLISVGRLVEKKGMEYSIRALAEILEKHKNVHLTIIGEGPLNNSLLKIVTNLQMTKYVTFKPFLSHGDVINELDASHLFILSCVTAENGDKEGIPNSLMEAQACGLPVISTEHGGIPELVISGKTGYLAKERKISELTGLIRYLFENQDEWGTLGISGRKHIEDEFNISRQSEKLEKMYSKII